MNWAAPSLSHHCIEATMSVVALCNSEVESPHLLAIGGNVGNVDVVNLATRSIVASFIEMHQNNVLDIAFRNVHHLLSFDRQDFLHIDLETSNRVEILHNCPITSFTFYRENTPILASGREAVYLCDLRTNPVALMEQDNVTELCLLPDEVTLAGLSFKHLVLTDIRNPIKFFDAGVDDVFEKIVCNDRYLVGVTEQPKLISFELPFQKEVKREMFAYDTPFISKPAFIGDYVAIGDESGMIFVADLETDNIDLILAGHTHGGQIRLPFLPAPVVPSKYGSKFANGIIKDNKNIMIITRGLGTSILPFRFCSVPELIIIN